MKRAVIIYFALALTLRAAEPAQEAAARIAKNLPLTPPQALAALKTEPGVRIDLVAAEPLTGDPVALAFDEQGRLFVAENRGYPEGPGEGQPPMGIIALLEDTDQDGRFDKRTAFATGLTYPNGLMCWRGGIFVTCAPDIFYLKDTDGDGKADLKKVVLTGFELGKTTQIRTAHPTLGMDGWIYLTSGLTGGKVTSPLHPERKPVEFTKNDSRFHPDTFEFEVTAGVGQFGLCFDDFGRKFTVDNRHPLQQVVLQPRYLKRNPYLAFSETVQDVALSGELGKVFPLAHDQTTASYAPTLLHTPHAGTFTSSCGSRIYGGDALPPEFRGNAFICEPAQALVQRQVISPNGVAFQATHARPGTEIMVTADSWFRPVFAQNAPDGALYVASMYRNFIDHPQYVPEEMRSKLDFITGRNMGRIYRLSATGWKAPRQKINLGNANARELVRELDNPKIWWRETAQRLLIERREPAAVPLLKSAVTTASTPQGRVLALRTLAIFGALEEAHLRAALADKHPAVREHGLQLMETHPSHLQALRKPLLQLADDPDPRVRFHTGLLLGELGQEPELIPVLAKIAVRDVADRWARAAVLSSIGARTGEFLEAVLAQASPTASLATLLAETCRMVGASQPPEKLVHVIHQLTGSSQLDYTSRAAAVSGLGEALRSRKLTLHKLLETASPVSAQAREQLASLMKNATRTALDASQPMTARQSAIGLLAFSDYASAGEPLKQLLRPQQPTEMQTAAAKALLQFTDPAVAAWLLESARWRSFTPPVRETLLAALLAQPAGTKALLAAVESGAVAATNIDPRRRTQLTKHRDKAIAAKATELFKDLQGGDRMKVYEDYKAVLKMKGDITNGQAMFAKNCASCHVMNGQGAKVGPELSGMRNQPAEVLLLHILVPSYEIVAGFNAYEVETRDGRTAAGLLASETPTSVTLRRALGEEETILRKDISSMTSGALSLMPDELEKAMNRQELADLLAYLKASPIQ